jgi:undecaprenyl-diphosphatase
MVNFLRAVVLGILQGLTEFLPISSSGHLVLVPWLLDWPEPSIVFDTIVHWGTLLATVTYFRADLIALARAWLDSVRERSLGSDPQRRLAWLIVIASIPAGLAGTLFKNFFESLFSRPDWVAIFLLITGLLLVTSEAMQRRRNPRGETDKSIPEWQAEEAAWSASENPGPLALPLSMVSALFIGLAQALAIAPGISRSGATIAAGLLVGLGRRESARFSFLLATPAIVGAGALQLMGLAESGPASDQIVILVLGFIAAGVTGYLAIRFLLSYLQRHTLNVFAVYCWLVGFLGLVVYWLR